MSRRRPSLARAVLADMLKGTVLGDFADKLGLAGGATQIALDSIPLVGTLCAIRDCIASSRRGDHLGALLNLLALIPLLGAFPKTAEVVHHMRRFGKIVLVVRGSDKAEVASATPRDLPDRPPRNGLALASLLSALMAPLLLPLFGVGLVVPVVTIATGHMALRYAALVPGHGSRRSMALLGLMLGYLYLAAEAVVGILLLLGFKMILGPH